MDTANILLIITAVLIALFLAIFQYIFNNKEKSQLNYWLSFLRFLTYLSIFLLLINPSIKKEETTILKPNLAITVDNSSSIKYNSLNTYIERVIDKFKTNKSLNSKFNIDYYSFGEELNSLDSLNFKEKYTNIYGAINSLSAIYKKDVNPLVLLTDGNQTVGNSLEFLNYKSPVYPLIVGDTTVLEDIYIGQLNVNKNTFINNQFPVEVFVNYDGGKEISKKLSVYYKGKRIYTKDLQFSKTENVNTVSFFLTAENKGNQYYSVKIEELENEQNTINNTKNFSINVIEDKTEILILTDLIHPDLGMFKKSIESNKQRSVTIKNINDNNINISKYQLITLYQPNNKFNNVFQEIKSKKLNYFVVSGVNTDWDFLNTNQNIFSKKAISVTENYHSIFNVAYANFINTDIGFSDFPPLEDSFGAITFSVPYQTFLFQKINTIKTQQPLLATFEHENQKGGVLFGENIWRWRMHSFNTNKTFELFDEFFSNLIQYLSSNYKSQRLNVSVNPLYFSNETVKLTANYLDENFNFDDRVNIWLTVSNKENNYLNKIPFSLVNNRFIVELNNLAPAEYTYIVSVENQKNEASGIFKILPFEIEKQFTQSNDKPLKILASKTNGNIFYSNKEDTLIENLLTDNRYKSIEKYTIVKTPLINFKWLLALILGLLSIEWFVRKYFGKI